MRIYRLVTKSSVEEDIVERAKRKLVLDHLVIQRMDTTGRTVLAKGAVGGGATATQPFNKEELACILKFGAQELFKEKEGEEQDPEVDIDAILDRAETADADEAAHNAAADELLSAFKVANIDIDEHERLETREVRTGPDWMDIIPAADRARLEEEESLALQKQLTLPPRQRNKISEAKAEEDSDEDWRKDKKGKGKGKPKHGSDSDSDDESDDDRRLGAKKARKVLFGFSEAEVKRFLKTVRKFARPHLRLEAIGDDAGLAEEHSTAEIRQLVEALVRSYRQALAAAPDDAGGTGAKKGGPSFRFAGLEVPLRPLAKAERELEPLYGLMPESASERRHWALPVVAKLCRNWDCAWEEADDAALLRGIYEHGYGSWDSIKMDPDLGLTEKLLPADKKKKPQANHIVSRVDYLLRLIAKQCPTPPPLSQFSLLLGLLGVGTPAPAKKKREPEEPAPVASSAAADHKPANGEERRRAKKAEAPPAAPKPKREPKEARKAEGGGDPEELVAAVAVNPKFAKDMENRKSKHFQEVQQRSMSL